MRVISGSARGTKLKMVPGDTTRPIMDRVKESLFNIIGNDIYDTRWLDIFAGTGQVGIEALSRGATECLFIDNTRAAIKIIQSNLKQTRLQDKAHVHQSDAFAYVQKVRAGAVGKFDYVYVAPPQYKSMWVDMINELDADPAALLTSSGSVVVQIDPKEFKEVEYKNLEIYDQRRYGRTLLVFYEMKADLLANPNDS